MNRRTGALAVRAQRLLSDGWREHYPPLINYRQTVRSERLLSEEERELLCDRLRAGATRRAIGRELGWAASTISREVARNSGKAGAYRPAVAQRLAAVRLRRPRARRLGAEPVLRAAVQGILDKAWSSEQISHALRERFPGVAVRQLCHESIYQPVYYCDSVLSRHRGAALRTRRRRRRPRPQGGARTFSSLRDMTSIYQRSVAIEDRVEPVTGKAT